MFIEQIAAEAGAQHSGAVPIGNANEGGFTDTIWDNGAWANAGRFQAVSNTVVSTVYAKVGAVAGKYKCAIYADAGGVPGALLCGTAEVISPSDGWQAFALASSFAITNGASYWLAIWSDDANARVYYSDAGGTLRWGHYDYGAWPDPVSTTGGGTLNYCIYATAGAAPPAPPVITLQPENQLVNLGSNATFAVSAVGASPLSYQWYHNSTNALAGITNSYLLLTGVADVDVGWYSVLVSNAAGTVLSSNAQLVVNHPPVPASPTLARYWGSGFRAPDSVLRGADADGDSLTVSSVTSLSVHGAAVSVGDGWVTYAPPVGQTDDDRFDYTVTDGRGGFSVGTASVVTLTNRGPALTAVWEGGSAGKLRLVGSGIPFRSYTFEVEESVGAGWQPIGAVMSDASGVFTCVESLSLGVSGRFYRVTTY